MENLPVSVIVITRNSESTLEECLTAVQMNNPAEIIVVDGNSTDRTLEIAGNYTERIYSDEGRGKSYARQLGAEQAKQEYIAYVDSDVTLMEGALATMLTEFQGSDYITIHARSVPNIKCTTYWEWASRQHSRMGNARGGTGHIGMLASLFRRETILKYGFELSCRGRMDDVDLDYRMRKDGHKFGVSSALEYHHVKSGFKSFVRYRFFFGQVHSCYIRKYGLWRLGSWPPLTALYWLGVCLIKGKLRLILYFIAVGVIETAGMAKGFLEMIGETLRRK